MNNPESTVKSIKDLCEYIWFIEEKYNLLNYQIEGVKPWQAIRMNIYYQLAQELGIYSLPHSKFQVKDKIINLLSIIKNSFSYNPFFSEQSDVLIFPHSRTKRVDGENIDIYSHYLVNDLLAANVRLTVLEYFCLGRHNAQPKSYKKYMDIFCLSDLLIRPFFICRLKKKDRETINRVEKDIYAKTGVNINLNQKFRTCIKNFKTFTFQLKLLFNRIKPKAIYLVVSYDKPAIIKTAKDLGVRVIELQHGTFSKYHLGYSFPEHSKTLDYFPDELYVWNDFWKNLIRLPIPMSNIKNYGFKYFEVEKTKYVHYKKQSKRIIILSQGVLGDSLANILQRNFRIFNGMTIYYKLHPSEYERWHKYEVLDKLSKLSNFHVLTDCNLYQEFAESEYMAGVFSTALYEGDMFGCKPVLFNLPGIEYMDSFIESHKLKLNRSMYINLNDENLSLN